MSWCSAPTSPATSGAAWGREVPAMPAYAAAHRLAPSSQKAISPTLCPLLTSAVTIAAVSSRRQFLGPCALCGDPLDEALTPEHCRGRDDNSAQQTTQQREDTD